MKSMIQAEPVSGLLLDETNPRFAKGVGGQDDAVTALLLDAPSKMVNLAADIARQGMLNPTEYPVVVEEDGDLVVIEGNRRLACLKVLSNPELASIASSQAGKDLVKQFKELARSGSVPRKIDVYVAPDRESARHWLELRHTGENDGVGVLGWAAWQANNFRRRRGTQADRATTFCEAIFKTYPNDDSLLSDVQTVRSSKLTTLGRLVSDPEVRRNFGFDFTDDEVVFYFEPGEMLAGFRRVFADLAGELSVTNIKTKNQRVDYVKVRANDLPDRGKRLSNPRVAGASGGGGGKKEGIGERGASSFSGGIGSRGPSHGTGSQLGSGARPARPESVILERLRLPNLNAKTRKMLKGAQAISIEDSPQIAAVLVRIILELVASEGIEKSVVLGNEGDSLKKKIRNALLALDPNCGNPVRREKSLEMAWIRTQEEDGIAVQSMNAFVHNIYGDPTAEEVRVLSATFRPLLEGVDRLIGSRR